jgi:hypothetical protein
MQGRQWNSTIVASIVFVLNQGASVVVFVSTHCNPRSSIIEQCPANIGQLISHWESLNLHQFTFTIITFAVVFAMVMSWCEFI